MFNIFMNLYIFNFEISDVHGTPRTERGAGASGAPVARRAPEPTSGVCMNYH